ncbi:iron ABC transporter ATP-binding component [Gammaproteobacteria bacterium]|nr:iron ABC transporter ATP-binding component [Gammaproteobacteria bacterium]
MTLRINPYIESVHLHNLTLSYQNHPAIHHLEAKLPLQETIAIIGPNGAGKSTLLKTIMGFLHPDSGEVCLPFAPSTIAYLPQQTDIDKSLPLSVGELVLTGLYQKYGVFSGFKKNHTDDLNSALEQVGLKGFIDRPLYSLSNGQFQRALFARIIMQKAQLILLDEPFNAVDAKTTLDLCHLIENWRSNGITIIAVIHDLHIAKQNFRHSLIIARELIATGASLDVINDANIERAYNTLLHWSEDAPLCDS